MTIAARFPSPTSISRGSLRPDDGRYDYGPSQPVSGVLSCNTRGYGGSEGKTRALGYLEALDA